ncbi:PDC sensor domain-containing protein [Peribacillus faecalis]
MYRKFYTSALTKKKCLTISCPISYQNEIFGVIGVDLSLTTK